MIGIKENIKKILPVYSLLPLGTVLVMNTLTYNGTRLFTQGMEHHNISNVIDDSLPFVPEFIIFYILAFVQWGIGFVVIARESREVCYNIFAGEIIAKLICMICFIVYPTTLVRPEITGGGLWNWLTQFIYNVDSADNLFPSIHCLESWVCFRGAMYAVKMPRWYKWITLIMSLAVFASTVLVKQHVVYDIVGAVVCVEFGLYVARRFRLGRVFENMEKLFFR